MMRALLFALVAVTSLGCSNDESIDHDGDGWSPPADCDDARADVYPGRDEIPYDGVDQDCSGSDLVDRDGDAFEGDEDCDDSRADVRPTGVDVCGDGVDQDCSGEDLACTDADRDRDGFSPNEGDCNDDDPRIHPRMSEVLYDGVDQDCDLATPDDDLDGDGFGIRSDCDDEDPRVYPGALDPTGDGTDADCDGHDAEGDYDRDGHLAEPEGDDCDDFDVNVHPTAVDVPGDGRDMDCDGRDDLGRMLSVDGVRGIAGFDDQVIVGSESGVDPTLVRLDVASGEIVRRRFSSTRVAVLHGQVWVASWTSSVFRVERWLATNETVEVFTTPRSHANDYGELLACGDVVFAAVLDTTDRTRTAVYRIGPDGAASLGRTDYGFDSVACAGEGILLLSRHSRQLSWFDASGQDTREFPATVDATFPSIAAAGSDDAWVSAAGVDIVRVPRDGSAASSYAVPSGWNWLTSNEVYYEQADVWWQARVLVLEGEARLVPTEARPVLGVVRSWTTLAQNGKWLAWEAERIHVPVEYAP